MAMSEGVSATTTKLYRDCLRLARHLAGETKKGDKMREMIRMQFRAGAAETDEGKIEMLKFAAVRGLSNYMALEAGAKDPKVKAAMKAQTQRVQAEAVDEQTQLDSTVGDLGIEESSEAVSSRGEA
mmetsp:Transcript_30148/g.44667  ORF Transcript_30148/g.44667 Transcript_30148/m.44667 type:complete len:126 (-) Transcript_30148:54-431(-)